MLARMKSDAAPDAHEPLAPDPATPARRIEQHHAAGSRAQARLSAWPDGDRLELRFAVTLQPGWYAYTPEAQDGLPVSVILSADPDPAPLTTRFPPAPDGHLSGSFTIEATAERVPPRVSVQLRIQACNGRTCEAPELLTFGGIGTRPDTEAS
jgi:hypothetical protein